MEFSRQEYWSGLPFPSSGDLPNPGIEPGSPSLQAEALLSEPKPPIFPSIKQNYISSVQSLSHVRLFATPWTAARQVSLSFTICYSLPKLMSIELMMTCNHLILFGPFSSHLQSFPASGSFPVSRLFASGGQMIGVSASASVPPMNIQD